MSYAWDLLDTELLQRLSARKFVSLSLDRRLRIPASAEALFQFLQFATQTNPQLLEPLEVGNLKYKTALDYLKPEIDQEGKPFKGVFDSGMPGAMSVEELMEESDLRSWLIQVGDQVTLMEVCLAMEGRETD